MLCSSASYLGKSAMQRGLFILLHFALSHCSSRAEGKNKGKRLKGQRAGPGTQVKTYKSGCYKAKVGLEITKPLHNLT